jgi:hypothetical protein
MAEPAHCHWLDGVLLMLYTLPCCCMCCLFAARFKLATLVQYVPLPVVGGYLGYVSTPTIHATLYTAKSVVQCTTLHYSTAKYSTAGHTMGRAQYDTTLVLATELQPKTRVKHSCHPQPSTPDQQLLLQSGQQALVCCAVVIPTIRLSESHLYLP